MLPCLPQNVCVCVCVRTRSNSGGTLTCSCSFTTNDNTSKSSCLMLSYCTTALRSYHACTVPCKKKKAAFLSLRSCRLLFPPYNTSIRCFSNRFGANCNVLSATFVRGDVLFPLRNHASIALRSYLCPSATHNTGSRIISKVLEDCDSLPEICSRSCAFRARGAVWLE